MDKVEIIRETQDFMNVESFSQLPFIRPAPPANKEKGAIRLFGIEFGAAGDETEPKDNNAVCDNGKEDEVDKMMIRNNSGNNIKSIVGGSDNESNRRFECHYCCRNFPTSQALGGHQNAHKRERQHAKREHLQSAMVHGGLVSHDAAHVYGLMNYSRHLAGSTPALHHHHHPTYPSWNTNNTTSSSQRFYGSSAGSYGTQSAPINGSPLGLWRIPSTALQTSSNPNNSFNRDRSLLNPIVTPMFAGEEMKPLVVTGSANPLSLSQSRFVYESSSVQQDHVSLDLHL